MQHGYLIIADISGYTAFLTGSELDHAQDIIKSLIEHIIDNMHPPIEISKLEGDAIFCFTRDGSFLQAQTLLEMIENVYVAFHRFLNIMHLNTTCTCTACKNIPTLDLKFVLHHGEFLLQHIGQREELSGPDVILIHRLLKNQVVEKTGFKAYTFLTKACAEAVKLGSLTEGMLDHHETYEHLGMVQGYTYDLGAIWEERKNQKVIVISNEEADFSIEYDLPVGPALAWDYFHENESRRLYSKSTVVETTGIKDGRAAVGTTFHCYHGKADNKLLVIDWRPFEYFTLKIVPAFPLKVELLSTIELTPDESGTKVVERYTRPVFTGGFGRFIGPLLWRLMIRKMVKQETSEGAMIMKNHILEDLQSGAIVTHPQPV